MSEAPRRRAPDPRRKDAATVRQAAEGILLVVGLAAAAASVGGLMALVVSWVY